MEANVGRALWLAERRKGIGGTDAAAILGVSPWKTAYEVWLEKRDAAPERPDSERMWWGRELEDLIARRYTEVTGRALAAPGLVAHPEHACLLASPDRVCVNEQRGVEIKTTDARNAHEWGAPGTDEVPQHYLVQCLHYMLVTGFPVWDVAVLIGGNDLRIYTVLRDAEVEQHMVRTLTTWWHDHVEGDFVPEITGARSTADALAARFPTEQAGYLLDADERGVRLLAELATARRDSEAADTRQREIENNLKAVIGESSGLKAPDFRVTWTAVAGRTAIDWEAIARTFAPSPVELAHAIADHTTKSPGVRRFVFKEGGK